MYQKFTANGEDITDLFDWDPDSDVRSGGYGAPSTLTLYPFCRQSQEG